MIPLSSPHLDESDFALVREALASRRLASGPMAETFEREMAARHGSRYAVATCSGTAALHMAVIAAGISDGDLVITSPFSFVASANVILYERGIPVFVDIDPDTLSIDSAKAVEAIETIVNRGAGWQSLLPRKPVSSTPALKAVLPVHIFGRPVEMRDIVEACRRTDVAVVEDACESLGASLDGVPVGRCGDVGAFAFYPNKQITAGEGGMLLTDNEEWADLFRALRNQGRSTDERWLRHDRLGFNYRMDEMSAALGLSQFRRLDDLMARRAAVAERYDANLKGMDGVLPYAPLRQGMTRSWFLYAVRLSPAIDRDALMARLARRGIMSRPYFWPIHLQPFYMELFGFLPGDFPHAEAAGHSMLSLPMPLASGLDDVDYVCEVFAEELHAG
jgi:dTDP-4-amino-4,6-dideoxygalactose transaminase